MALAVLRIPYKGAKSEVAHVRADWLHDPCRRGGSPTRGQKQKWPTCKRIGYITPAVLEVPCKRTNSDVPHL